MGGILPDQYHRRTAEWKDEEVSEGQMDGPGMILNGHGQMEGMKEGMDSEGNGMEWNGREQHWSDAAIAQRTSRNSIDRCIYSNSNICTYIWEASKWMSQVS